MRKLIILTFVLIMAVSVANAQLASFTGSLSTPSGVDATGYWAEGFMISWNVAHQADNSWLYTYSFTDLNGANLMGTPSHLTLEVSPNVTRADFWGLNGDTEMGDIDGIDNALKLDWESNEYSLYSWRRPVWGDFYTKDGKAGAMGLNSAQNAGFGDPDPMMAASNGSIGNKILRPDTEVIPEPSTMLLLGIGLAGAGLRRKFRREN